MIQENKNNLLPEIDDEVRQLLAEEPTPAPQPRPQQKRRRRRGLTTGAVVYYSIYLILIIAFFVGMTVATVALRRWLVNYEASQPGRKSEQIFTEYFADPDWARLYAHGPIKGYEFLDTAGYVAYMEQTVGDASIIKYKTSAGLSGGEKYVIRAVFPDGSYYNFATFTLKNQAAADELIADWQLSDITLSVWFENPPEQPTVEPPPKVVTYHCTVITDPANTVTVNGITLDDSHVIRTVTTTAESYLPAGIHGYRLAELYIDGLTEQPAVSVTDAGGNSIPMAYDEATCAYTQDLTRSPIGEAEKSAILSAAATYCKYMIEAADKNELKQWFDPSKEIYATITGNDTWMQSYASYGFSEEQTVSGYYRYSEELFSAKVSLTLNVNRKDGTVKTYELDTTFFMEKQGDGWKVTQMTNVDVQAQTTMVRLTYIQDGKQLLSEMVDASANRLTTPAVTGPEGETFLGWFTMTVAENGDKTYDLKFTPGEDGTVSLPTDYTLEPMTLYALFQAEEG